MKKGPPGGCGAHPDARPRLYDRPPAWATDRPFTGRYREAFTGVPDKGTSIPRADVAHFILKALKDDRYHGASVGLAI